MHGRVLACRSRERAGGERGARRQEEVRAEGERHRLHFRASLAVVEAQRALLAQLRAERREGKDRLVVRKTLVDLKGPAFAAFAKQRDAWRLEDRYACPGPMVFDATGGTLDPPLTTRLAAEAAGKREKAARERSRAATGAAAA